MISNFPDNFIDVFERDMQFFFNTDIGKFPDEFILLSH